MGIKNLSKLLLKYAPNSISYIKSDQLSGSTVAIDANLFIYRSVFAIRRGMGKDIEHTIDKKTFKVTHIYIMFIRLFGFINMKILPVFVFDSSYSYLKDKTMNKRAILRKDLKDKYMNATSNKERRKYYHVSEDITHREYGDIINLIQLFGFPYIIAPEESDSQCAYMINSGLVDYVISDDMDMLAFGCNKIIRRFSTSHNKTIQLVNLTHVLSGLRISMSAFIQLCILLGSDYADTIDGIGPEKAYSILYKYGSIMNAQKHKMLPKSYTYKSAYNYFVKSKHMKLTKYDITFKKIDIDKIKEFLLSNGFDNSNTINNQLDKLQQLLISNEK